MLKEEAFDDLKATWEKYALIDHPDYTTDDKRQVDDLLDDIERLIK